MCVMDHFGIRFESHDDECDRVHRTDLLVTAFGHFLDAHSFFFCNVKKVTFFQ